MKKIFVMLFTTTFLVGCDSTAERQVKEMKVCHDAGFSSERNWYGFSCKEQTLSAQTILQVQNLKERVKALEEKLK